MLRFISASIIALACTLGAAGCGDDDPVTAPIETPVEITETFTGTLTLLGANIHTFSTQRAGTAEVQIDSLAPDSAAVVSLIFGTWNGNNCAVSLIKDNATTASFLDGNASVGSFCVRISDIGLLTQPTTYTLTVTHF